MYSATLLVLSPRNLPILATMWPSGLTMTAPAPAGPGFPRAAPSVKRRVRTGAPPPRPRPPRPLALRLGGALAFARSRSTFEIVHRLVELLGRRARGLLDLGCLADLDALRARRRARGSRAFSASSTRSAAASMSLPRVSRS